MLTLGRRWSINGRQQTKEETMAEKHEKVIALPGIDAFKKASDEQLNRLGQMLDEAGKMQARWFEASNQSIDDSRELAKSSLKYFNDLSTEWTRLSMDGSKKALEFFAR